MKRIAVVCLIFILCDSIYAQESGLVVRYDFTKGSYPPWSPFYLRIYINDIFIDSTKPHTSSPNVVRIKLEKGNYHLKIEGITIREKHNYLPVMEWISKLVITKGKSRVQLILNYKYQIQSSTINY